MDQIDEILGDRAGNLIILKLLLTTLCRGKEEEEGEDPICSCQSCQTGSGDFNTNLYGQILQAWCGLVAC